MSLGLDSYESLAGDIRAVIEVQRATLRYLAAQTGISASTLSTALRAKTRLTPRIARELARVLGVGHQEWVERSARLAAEPFAPDLGVSAGAVLQARPVRGGTPGQVQLKGTPNGLLISGSNNVVNLAPSWAPPPPDPSEVSTPEEFNDVIHELYSWAGCPSLRRLEEISRGELRRATVNDMLRDAHRLPKREMVQAFVTACGAASEMPRWFMAWQHVRETLRHGQ